MGKHIGDPYDPAIRKTEHGSRLYQVWRKVRNSPHCEEWEYFPTFYEWATKDYTLGAWLILLDPDKPYEPGNCIWHMPGCDDKNVPVSWPDEWNRAVNRVRKHYGMPPLEGTNYDDI